MKNFKLLLCIFFLGSIGQSAYSMDDGFKVPDNDDNGVIHSTVLIQQPNGTSDLVDHGDDAEQKKVNSDKDDNECIVITAEQFNELLKAANVVNAKKNNGKGFAIAISGKRHFCLAWVKRILSWGVSFGAALYILRGMVKQECLVDDGFVSIIGMTGEKIASFFKK